MNFLLILVMILCFALNAALTRAFQLRFPGDRGKLRLYQALFSLVAAIAFGASQLFSAPVSGVSVLPALLCGVAFGLFYYTAVAASSACYEIGSMSLTSIIMNMSLLIPLMYSCIVLGEKLTVLRLVGVALIALTMVLAVDKSPQGGTSRKWWGIVLMGFLANGITAIIQKAYVLSDGEGFLMLLMAVAYLTAAVLFVFDARKSAVKQQESLKNSLKIALLAALFSGLGSFGGNALLGLLCAKVNAAILYPFMNGGLCIVSALLSFMIFRERPNRRKLCAIATGLAAIVLLNL